MNECLWCSAILVPVIFILLSHAPEIDRKRRIPIRKTYRLRDARILGNEIAIGSQPSDRCGARKLKRGGSRFETATLVPYIVFERDFFAVLHIQFACGPLVEDDGRSELGLVS